MKQKKTRSGHDVTIIPELEYEIGLQRRSRLSQGFALNRAAKVLLIYRDADDGFKILERSAKAQLTYLGVDLERLQPSGALRDKSFMVHSPNKLWDKKSSSIYG